MTHPIAQQFTGFALAEREQNMYDDSYFHLSVWDPDEAKPEEYQYAATAYPSTPMHPRVVSELLDATLPSVRAAYAQYKARNIRKCAAAVLMLRMESFDGVFKGDTVRVDRGRKTPKGTTGKVIHVEDRPAYVGNYTEKWALVVTDSGASWSVKAEYCTVLSRGPVAQELFDLSC